MNRAAVKRRDYRDIHAIRPGSLNADTICGSLVCLHTGRITTDAESATCPYCATGTVDPLARPRPIDERGAGIQMEFARAPAGGGPA